MRIEEFSCASVIPDHADPEHWPLMARYWRHIGSPLRPAKDDLEAYRHYASGIVETKQANMAIPNISPLSMEHMRQPSVLAWLVSPLREEHESMG